MCGITGYFLRGNGETCESMRQNIVRMSDTLEHRGPDDSGDWVDASAGIALGFRRLAIIDVSPLGHQPMKSASGRYVICFNGEVYNFQEIRAGLAADGHTVSYRGGSDTEVILAAIEAYGIKDAIARFTGMFAIALWDREERSLTLIRDRIGVKPLYYGFTRGAFIFGSELKSLRAYPGFDNAIDRGSIALQMRFGYIPAPYSIYAGIRKLSAGCMVTLNEESTQHLREVPYWSLKSTIESAASNPFRGSDNDATDELDRLLKDATRLRMIADVPLGVFLSGGIDSSVVTALMQSLSSKPVKTFTIGFKEDQYDEAQYARSVARLLSTEHTEMTVSASDAQNVIPELPALYDEPFADASQIPTYLVARLARRHVTVSLSGDGGDELFGGYLRHFGGRSMWNLARRFPSPLRTVASKSIHSISPSAWGSLIRMSDGVLPKRLRQRNPVDKLLKIANVIDASSPDEMYRRLVSHWAMPGVVVGGCEHPCPVDDPNSWPALSDFTDRMIYLDTMTYLPDDVLVKVDRATMGTSLEARGPLLDHRIMEFAWRIPLDMKVRNGEGKWLLKQVLYRYLPEHLFTRPKAGFSVPIDEWLRGPLREWAEDLLNEASLRHDDYLDARIVRKVWEEHLSRKHNHHTALWTVLMFQAWKAAN